MKIIITGAKAIGAHLAKLLSRNNEDVTLIDENPDRLAQLASNYDILTMQAHPCNLTVMREVGVGKADLFIAVTSNENQNVQACVMAKALGAKKTVAKVDDKDYTRPEYAEFYSKLGLDSIIYPEKLAAQDIINGLKMSWVRQRWDVHEGALVMLGIKLREGCTILGKPLREISANGNYHVVAVKRGGDTFIPNGNDTLERLDLAFFMTTKNYIPELRKVVGKEKYTDVKNVMIMGGGKTAVRSVTTMPEYMKAKIIDSDSHRCDELNELLEGKCLIINGDGRDSALLLEEGIKNTQAFVALTGNSETNILACLAAKKNGVRKTVAMVENLDYVGMAESLDIGTIINKKAIAASHIYQMMLDANVSNVRFLTTANADVAEFVAEKNSRVTKKQVKDLNLPKGMTIGGLVRGGEGMLVTGTTQIQTGDSVVVFIHGANMKRIEDMFNEDKGLFGIL